MLYPLRRTEIAEKKGRAFIAEGLENARLGRWYDAANLLRLGLARFPRDYRARFTLAQFYQLTNRNSLALKTLTDGVSNEYPGRRYLDFLFNLASQGEDYETVAEVSARFLPIAKQEGLIVDQRWLREKRYGALTAAGRHAEALALAELEDAGDSREERRGAFPVGPEPGRGGDRAARGVARPAGCRPRAGIEA